MSKEQVGAPVIPQRASGLLAHFSSLPSPYGIGDIGWSSYRFMAFLQAAGQTYWQFLPTTPTSIGFGNSPYTSICSLAGSYLLLCPQLMLEAGYLEPGSLLETPEFSPYQVDYGVVSQWKKQLLTQAFESFQPNENLQYLDFVASTPWLTDYCLFMVLKELHFEQSWVHWAPAFAQREPQALEKIAASHRAQIDYYRFEQYEFYRQWQLLRQHARQTCVQLFGDLPIYVAHDSVDVWANQDIFLLDEKTAQPSVVAGVPPDYFSETGQRWGNPLYDWHCEKQQVKDQLLTWWHDRLANMFSMVDLARIDHFRGFASYWSIPASEKTAINGKWLPGPGSAFFTEIFRQCGPLRLVAEDLGIITEDVTELRDFLGLPGMKVLQFAFDGDKTNPFLPYNHVANSVVYTGTHDNDTTLGWFLSDRLNDSNRTEVKLLANGYLGDNRPVHHDFIYLAQASVASLCLIPLQDLFGFGSDCRMNTPGEASGNWQWRCPQENFSDTLASWLLETTNRFGRLPGKTTRQ